MSDRRSNEGYSDMTCAKFFSFVLMVLLAAGAYAQQGTSSVATRGAATAGASATVGGQQSGQTMGTTKGGSGKSGEANGAKQKAPVVSEGVKLHAPKGDRIKLKNGKVIEGVQVIRSTPKDYQVEIVNAGVMMSLPRDQVESVEYDNVEPSRNGGSESGSSSGSSVNVIAGQKLSPELENKLGADLSHPPLVCKDEDLLQVLDKLGQRAHVKIVPDQSVLSMKPKDRRWTLRTKEGATLLSVLSTDLPARFPHLTAQYQFNKIVITRKSASGQTSASGAPRAQGASAGGPATAPGKPPVPVSTSK